MKKLLCIFISIILCFSFGMTAFAEEDDTAPNDTQSASQPRLMVESYTLSKPDLKPNESATLEIKLKNHSLKKNINNIAITLSDEANEISTIGVNSGYIDKIIPNSTYTYTATIRATKTASEGVHKLAVSLEYEDDDYTQYTSTSQISINITKKKKASTTKKVSLLNLMSFFSSLIVSFKFLMNLSLLSFFRITDKFALFDGDTYLPSRE